MNSKGIGPAMTTCFGQDSTVDHGFLALRLAARPLLP